MSPWHDVSLRNTDGTVNFVCEIPKDTMAKMEVATVWTRAMICLRRAQLLFQKLLINDISPAVRGAGSFTFL